MPSADFAVTYSVAAGLRLTWAAGHSIRLASAPLRVRVRGHNVFRVWNGVDSGESAPVWAEPDLDLTFFGGQKASPGCTVQIERFTGRDGVRGVRCIGSHSRARVDLLVRVRPESGQLEMELAVANPQPLGGASLPLCALDLTLDGIPAASGSVYESAHAYGGRTFGWGEIARLDAQGVPFVHGCIGLALPLVYVHQPQTGTGLEFEFMLDARPTAWLARGTVADSANWRLNWALDRLLEPGEAHAVGGQFRLSSYAGRPVEMLRRWRDAAETRYGLKAVPAPAWARHANIIEFNSYPGNKLKPFQRLDDPRLLDLLKSWKDMGYTAIFTVGHNNTGTHFLSPYDYAPCDAAGGLAAEKQYLDWAHELDFRAFLWVTTVGIERRAPEVTAHPDWWTHRADGSLFYAWDSNPQNGYLGYAPDGDPLSVGWRAWLKNEVTQLIRRGYDGIFIDGCIPRASNHARRDWPGHGRNGVADQVRELAEHLRRLGPELAVFVEDEGLYAMACCEVTCGRYYPNPPYFKKAYWDHGMGGGPDAVADAPQRVPPERARDYLLNRYASALPGVVHKEGHEGYYSEETRPWGVQMLFGGGVPKTHSQYVDFAEKWQPISDAPETPAAEKTPEHRRRGHAEFVALLRFCRDDALVKTAPLSIEGFALEGDAAVVGMLRPTAERALLALIQFADRPARVTARLVEPVDVPAEERASAGRPELAGWNVREVMRSMVNPEPWPARALNPGGTLDVELGAYGFRIFELTRRSNGSAVRSTT